MIATALDLFDFDWDLLEGQIIAGFEGCRTILRSDDDVCICGVMTICRQPAAGITTV